MNSNPSSSRIMMELVVREFTSTDIAAAVELWKASEGIGLSAADEPAALTRYLERNPGMSFTAYIGTELAGAVLCGHDGRRGFLHHLAVRRDYRRLGIGRILVERCHQALSKIGIDKVHIFVYHDNQNALAFWKGEKYIPRDDLVLLSVVLDTEKPEIPGGC